MASTTRKAGTTRKRPSKAQAAATQARANKWGAAHPLALALMGRLPKACTLVGAHGMPGAGPNKKGEMLVKAPGMGTVAYVSLASKGTALHAVRSTTGLSVTGPVATVATAIMRQARAAAANKR